MELTTLGAALKFAMELEKTAMEVFGGAAEAEPGQEAKKLFTELSASSAGRKATMEKLYNENIYSDMDTGIFEPIQPMSGESYALRPGSSADGQSSSFILESMEMEKRSAAFYSDLASRYKPRRRSMARQLEKMAEDNARRGQKLEKLR